MIELTLDTVCNGQLVQEFADAIPKMVEAVQATQKAASVTLKVTLKPIKGMTSTFTTHVKSQVSLPVVEHGGFAQLADGKLITESPILQIGDEINHQMTIEEVIELEGRND